jgi:KaiC/GvpD/RAD55 family RecA-like ATPase
MNPFSTITHTSLRALSERTFPPRDFILHPWLQNGETAVVWGPTGAGKSLLCTGIALAVAGGVTVGRWTAPKPRKVLLIDGEMNIQDLLDRTLLLRKGREIPPEANRLIMDNLEFSVRQDQAPGRPFYDLTNEDAQEALAKKIKEAAIELVILDNLTTLTDDLEDENASAAFKGIQKFLLRMKQQDVATILVHHANKAGTDMRGSSALAATFEVVLHLNVPSGHRPGQASFTTEFRKFRARGGDALQPEVWTLEDGRWCIEGAEPEVDTKKRAVLDAVVSERFASQKEIALALNLHDATVSRKLKELEREGLLTEEAKRAHFRSAKEGVDQAADAVSEAHEETPAERLLGLAVTSSIGGA